MPTDHPSRSVGELCVRSQDSAIYAYYGDGNPQNRDDSHPIYPIRPDIIVGWDPSSGAQPATVLLDAASGLQAYYFDPTSQPPLTIVPNKKYFHQAAGTLLNSGSILSLLTYWGEPLLRTESLDNIDFDIQDKSTSSGYMQTIFLVITPKLKATGRRVRVSELEVEYSPAGRPARILRKFDTDGMTIIDHIPIGADGVIGKYSYIARVPPGSTWVEV